MKRKSLLIHLATVFAVVLSLGFIVETPVLCTEAQLVKIEPVTAGDKIVGIKLDPPKLTIAKQAVVIFLSGVPGSVVKVIFNDPVACEDVTADPKLMKFYSQWKDCYTTTYLPFAEASSMQLKKAGALPYMVRTEDGKMTVKGEIVVK
jgi:hypothetical protein